MIVLYDGVIDHLHINSKKRILDNAVAHLALLAIADFYRRIKRSGLITAPDDLEIFERHKRAFDLDDRPHSSAINDNSLLFSLDGQGLIDNKIALIDSGGQSDDRTLRRFVDSLL